jgi:hypothetical protein
MHYHKNLMDGVLSRPKETEPWTDEQIGTCRVMAKLQSGLGTLVADGAPNYVPLKELIGPFQEFVERSRCIVGSSSKS